MGGSTIILDIILLLIGAFVIWRGYKNGFVKLILKFFRMIIAIAIAIALSGPVGALISEKFVYDPVYDAVHEKMENTYENSLNSVEGQYKEQMNNYGSNYSDYSDYKNELNNYSEEDFNSAADELPDFLKDLDLDMDDLSGNPETAVEEISQKIAEPIAGLISKFIAIVVVYIIAFILLTIAIHFLNALISKFKMIDRINKILGLVWGILTALVIWIIVGAILNLLFGDISIISRTFGQLAVPLLKSILM